MTQLTQQEIEMIEREAGLNATKYAKVDFSEPVKAYTAFVDCYTQVATKYLTQLKEERERSAKLLEVLGLAKQYFDDRADCDYQGDPPYPVPNYEMIMLSEIKTALNEYNNKR